MGGHRLALATTAAFLGFTTVAGADVRTAVVDDPQDTPSGAYDISSAAATVDNQTGTASVAVRLFRPLPAQPGLADYFVFWARQDRNSSCIGSDGPQDLYVNFDLADGTATVNVGPGTGFQRHPLAVSDDRAGVSVSFADQRLVGSDLRCLNGAASESGNSDSGYDSLETVPFRVDGATTPPCTADVSPAFTMDGPGSRIAWGRQAAVGIFPRAFEDYAGDGRIPMAGPGEEPFFTDSFDADVEQLLAQDTGATYFVQLDRGDPPADITATWTQFAGSSACIASINRRTRGFTGRYPAPTTRHDENDALLSIGPKRGLTCNALRTGRVTINVERQGRRARLVLRDACGRWTRGRVSRQAGLSIARRNATAEFLPGLVFRSRGRRTKRIVFAVTVSQAGRRLLRRKLISSVVHEPSERIFEGRDAFVNYCINHNRPIRSRGGRLYCVSPGFTERRVRWR